MLNETLELLERERQALLAAVERVAAADRQRRPAADRWSVAETLEHLALVERSVATLIATRGRDAVPPATEAPASPAPERVAALRRRDRQADAPASVQPTGRLSAAEALTALAASRGSLFEAVRAADPLALDRRTYHHVVLGRIVLSDWLALVAHHEARHAAQIDEIGAVLRR